MNLEARLPLRDPYLEIPLHGLQLIEASAGTGKTFTLATLVTRLVVERALRVGQILAVTFTDAATQELRERLRRRLALAARLAAALIEDPAAHGDSGDAEIDLTRALLLRQLQQESGTRLRARLQQAEREIDLAAIFTIHGFCARALAEHALETGQAFDPPEMIGSDRVLHDELAADLWRGFGSDALDAQLLQSLWSGPKALARDLDALLRAQRVLPSLTAPGPDPMEALQRAATNLRAAFAEHGDDLHAQLVAAIAGKVIHGGTYKPTLPGDLRVALQRWCAQDDLHREIDSRIDRLTPAKLRDKTNKGKHHATPVSPLCEAVAAYLDAVAQRREWAAVQAVNLLHRVRADALQRLARLKHARRLQSYDDLIDGVATALDGPHGDVLAGKLRRQYPAALVDEFQDTDARQWSIFRRVFAPGGGDAPAATSLFLIGDPKQAIYRFRGGDVHTYLAAARQAALAPPLAHNFRSRPALLHAIAALYAQAGDAAFVDERIRFHAVTAGAGIVDADYQRDGKAAPALTVRMLPADEGKPWKADDSRALATRACVAEIHAVLSDARAGRARIDGIPVQPGDIAVLVRSHNEATRIQSALVAAGIPAVAAGKQSLFATGEAGELLAVFEALLRPDDDGRLRAALATMLLGFDAAAIARLDSDGERHRQLQLDALAWRERWQRSGPLALVVDLCAAHAERLLALEDGERRLTNLLQLGETLQEADRRALGLHGLVDGLRLAIAEADSDDEEQLLRLESDARRVRIVTLHKSKGLEYPLVFLPYVGIGRDPKLGHHCDVPGIEGRSLHWHAGGEAHAAAWHDASEIAKLEQRAEEARLLYVGLTRAQHAVWLASGPLFRSHDTALAPMLADLAAVGACAGIVVQAGAVAAPPVALPPMAASAPPDARRVTRVLSRDWWVYSFTQLSNADAGDATTTVAGASERGAADEPESPPTLATGMPATGTFDADLDALAFDRRFSGSRFGNALHAALEHVEFAAWRDWQGGGDAPHAQVDALEAALRAEGYAEADLHDGIATLVPLVGHTLTVALPEGGRLCDLAVDARRAELEFHFALQPTSVDALLALLHAQGVLRDRHGFGLRGRIEGLVTGKIDLTYTDKGRYYLLDYKSNRLPDYDQASLAQAMAHSEYDLQALIYTVAMHRWLRFRLGEGYDYARDFGGVRYLFCRGLDAASANGRGVHAWAPSADLVHALDALFAGATMELHA